MDNEPDYSEYTLDELRDARDNIDRTQYPERAKIIDREYFLRQQEVIKPNYPHAELNSDRDEENPASDTVAVSQDGSKSQELALVFNGSTLEYFRIWIVNLCFTILTLGVFSAWAKVRKKRFLYSSLTLDGTSFQYLAKPGPILKGRIIAFFGFLVYYVASNFYSDLMPWTMGAGLILAPWVISRSMAFNARYSAFRNMTFYFKGGYLDAVKVLYVWGILPLWVIGLIFGSLDAYEHVWLLLIAMFLMGVLFPFWLRRIKKFIVEKTTYGGQEGVFTASGGQYFKIYFVAGCIMALLLIPLSILIYLLTTMTEQSWIMTYGSTLMMYGVYVLAYAFVKAQTGNLIWNKTKVGSLRFKSTLRSNALIGIYVTNALAILVSVGMLIPWAVMRTMRYRANQMRVFHKMPLTEFQGSEVTAVGALGSEAIDFFDVDLSL